ncbi:MAG: DUF2237 domain-containing protein [Devosia sp.]
MTVNAPQAELNVLGEPLEACSEDPMTGFFRTGACASGPDDTSRHLVCCEMTAEFLAFSRLVGNDLSEPRPEMGFPGLKPGNRWCLLAPRWAEAHRAGKAPRVVLLATHAGALRYTTLAALKAHALDLS